MRDEGERGHEEHEDRGAVLGVSVDLARHADQPEQPRRLQQSYQGGRLQESWRKAKFNEVYVILVYCKNYS